MTIKDFKIQVKKKTAFDRYFYYALSIAVIIGCLWIFYNLIIRLDKFYEGHHIFLYAIALFLFSLAASGLYLLPNKYKVITVDSGLSFDKKQQVIKKVLNAYNVDRLSHEQQYVSFNLRCGFWKTRYQVYLFFDEVGFAFSLQSPGGIIDFGGTEKRRIEIAAKIKEFSIEASQVLYTESANG